MKADVLREKFLSFFSKKAHKVFKSDSLIPSQDLSVLFTSAGMNQFKSQFLGEISDFKRAVSCQKCLRTDDLEKVGKTPYHHTFFEMLGNFSFGDYFKREAILWAWEFLTEELKIKEKDLWVSVYKDDKEAYSLWKDEIKIPQARILKFGEKENFWPANAIKEGPNGPCGPCSEIFFDRGKNIGCKRKECFPGCECGRFVEIWNLVFMQFNRKDGGILEHLPNKNIDTGMGLERMCSVLQGKLNNFEIDIFSSLVEFIESLIPKNKTLKPKNFIYAISDHIRAICFAISDGVIPSNEEKGYVIRKLIRKSFLYGKSLGLKSPFLYKIAPKVCEVMGSAYPELKENIFLVKEIILKEEENFISTLSLAPKLFSKEFSHLKGKKGRLEGLGHIAFKLYDTYGIPLELTEDWLEKKGFKILKDEFEYDLKFQRERSKTKTAAIFEISNMVKLKGETKFLGYKKFECKARILKIIRDNSLVNSISEGQEGIIILDKTVFYGESGGQIGDTGVIKIKKSEFEIKDTQRQNNLILHIGKVKMGEFRVSDIVIASIDKERRRAIARAHTSTHLLQSVLRTIFGEYIRQAGSLVEPDKLRFDFTYSKPIALSDLEKIEDIVNSYILENLEVTSLDSLTFEEAKKRKALAFFGDKYGKKVRIVSIGEISKELCGGTHLNSTGEIGLFRILSESSSAKGIRRIEAVCGRLAYKNIKEKERDFELEKNNLNQEILFLNREKQRLEKDLATVKIEAKFLEFKTRAKTIDGIRLISEDVTGILKADSEILRIALDVMRIAFLRERESAVIVLGISAKDKVNLICGITETLKDKVRADNIIKRIAEILGGSGGGSCMLAEAGARDASKLKVALDKAFDIVRDEINKVRE